MTSDVEVLLVQLAILLFVVGFFLCVERARRWYRARTTFDELGKCRRL